MEVSGYVWWIGGVERSTHASKRRFLKIFSVQRGTPRESDTASRLEEACLLNSCYVVAQFHTSLHTQTSWAKSDQRENNSHPWAQRFLHPFCVVFHTCIFSDSVLCLEKVNENPQSNIAWEDRLKWFKSSPEYRALDRNDGEPMQFEWNIFPTLELCTEVQKLLSRLSVTPEKFTGRIAQLVSLSAKGFGAGQWSFLGLGSEKKWYSICIDRPQGEWERIAELMMLKFAEGGHPVFRATSSLSRGQLKSKGGGGGNCQYSIAPTRERLKLFSAQLFLLNSSVFTEQSQKCVKNVTPTMIEQGDLLWKDNLTHCSCQV